MATSAEQCEFCGAGLPPRADSGRTGRPARYCSNACRQRAYRRRTSHGAAEPIRQPDSPLDALIGREHELADLERLIRRARLVTLVGSAGAGKSRIAHELATRVQFPGGVSVIELASLTAPPLLPQHIAAALRVRERPGQAMTDTLADALGAEATLIVLDNCEHVVEASAALTETLLRRCPKLTVLATSRESLELPGERIYRIGELTLPSGTNRGELLASDAVRLFIERARAAAPGFELTNNNGADIAGLCGRLDGNPLAIELAARRVRLLPVAEIVHRLDDRFDLLTGGSRSATTRHRDLRTAIEWSFDLLEPAEQAVLRRISVLAGGFTVTGAEATSAGAGVEARDVLDILTSLEAKSLVVADRATGRFRLLESIRLYGADRLAAAGERDRTYDRLVSWLLSLAEPVLGERVARSFGEIAPLDAERDNLLHTLEWTVAKADQRQVLIATALGRCWRQRGYATEGRRLLRAALSATDPGYPGRSAALAQAAWLATMQGDQVEALALATEALALEDPVARPRMYVRALLSLSIAQTEARDLSGARVSRERCVELVRPLGEPLDTAVCIHNLAYTTVQIGDLTSSAELLEECLALYRLHAMDPVPAEWVHTSAMLALALGDLAAAEERLRDGLRTHPVRDDSGMPATIGLAMIEGLALVAARRGDALRALRLGGAATTLREPQRTQPDVGVRQLLADAMAAARDRLGAKAARAAEQAGRRLDADAIVTYALDGIWREPGVRGGGQVLTRREETVAALLVDGLTNREIAVRLRIAERTVESHLEHIRARLDLRSRAQIAGWAVEHGVSTRR